MKIILFAGGTGKRFWPISRRKSPKQFLPIVNDKPLLRLRYEILKKGFKDEDIFVSTGIRYKKEVTDILPELPIKNFIFEPEMRDTGPAVSLAVAYVDNISPDEPISIQWSDHLIKKPKVFIESLNEAERVINQEKKVALIVVPARFPSPHRGYVKFGKKIKFVSKNLSNYEFKKFVEKPNKEKALRYIQNGHYGWNPGYWNLTSKMYFKILKQSRPDFFETIEYIKKNNFKTRSMEKFKTLEKISADYIFAEHLKPKDAKILLTDMGWSDVGEWIAFKEALQESEESNLVKGEAFDMDSKDTLIYNTQDNKLIATIGLNGMVIVNTPDVLAVFHKDDNAKIKELIKRMEEKGLENYL